MLLIDPTANVSPLADLERSVRGTRIEIGPGAVIDSFVKIKPAGGSGEVIIGAHVYLNSGTTIYTGNGVRIGDDTLIAANCTLAPTNHEFADPATPIRLQGFKPSRGGIVIGRDVWIGANSVVLDGAVIGDGCVVGAGSLVRGTLEPFGIYAGNPLRRVGTRGR
ncbi:acyltransferase [Polymorphum gilvum]|uniref:Putative acetyltransferase protein n=1 Tax=Polymorphum gilvum (strain LMG 25793 / CGMCC 1.9160 / SL003B-26A1) TaxID=991905 RepID=F2IVH8_POLGS|nr:acyltransferase [Polymorphum gilvum]ADZ72696.1 Putative acetyltransferase protein [Polymorphum gilvum SL003B-26A1]